MLSLVFLFFNFIVLNYYNVRLFATAVLMQIIGGLIFVRSMMAG